MRRTRVILLQPLLLLASGLLYGYYSPPGCRWSEPFSRPAKLLAGRLGFFGAKGEEGYPATLSLLRLPRALAVDVEAQLLYVSDATNHIIRVIDLRSPKEDGGSRISTVAGVMEESGTILDDPDKLHLNKPFGLALDKSRGYLYVADEGNHVVLLLTLSGGSYGDSGGSNTTNSTITIGAASVVAGTPGVAGEATGFSALLSSPNGLTLDSDRNLLYIADNGNSRLCVVDLETGYLSSIDISIDSPVGLAIDTEANLLYASDYTSHVVLKVDLASNVASVVAGVRDEEGSEGDGGSLFRGLEGLATEALLRHPGGLALDAAAQRLYIADTAGPAIRVLDLDLGMIALISGRPGMYNQGLTADDVGPVGLAITEATVPGVEVLWVIHRNLDPPPPDTYGEYFHFDMTGISGLVADDATNPFDVDDLPPSSLRMVRQFRRGVVVWVGQVRCWEGRTRLIGPQSGYPCPACTATCARDPPGVCIPGPCADAEYRFEVGDVIQLLGQSPDFLEETAIHTETPVQTLYMAEGNNFVVRSVNIAPPTDLVCHTSINQSWDYIDGLYA